MELPMQPNLYIYSRFKTRINANNPNVPIYMIGSGSDGNSIYIKPMQILIDLGFPYKKYSTIDVNFFLHVKYIFLTHQHKDHLNPSTLLKVLNMYPNVKVVLTPELYTAIVSSADNHLTESQKTEIVKYRSQLIITHEKASLPLYDNEMVDYQPYLTEHGDITNVGIDLTYHHIHLLYASDLDTLGPGNHSKVMGLSQSPYVKYNLMLLEANYDEPTLKEAIQDAAIKKANAEIKNDPIAIKKYFNQQYRASENLRHISEQESWQYVQKHLTDDGWFIPLHASRTYGTLIQNTTTQGDSNETH